MQAKAGDRNGALLQVAHSLMMEFPKLRQLATLSPLPGFRTWLETQISQQQTKSQQQVSLTKPLTCCLCLRQHTLVDHVALGAAR